MGDQAIHQQDHTLHPSVVLQAQVRALAGRMRTSTTSADTKIPRMRARMTPSCGRIRRCDTSCCRMPTIILPLILLPTSPTYKLLPQAKTYSASSSSSTSQFHASHTSRASASGSSSSSRFGSFGTSHGGTSGASASSRFGAGKHPYYGAGSDDDDGSTYSHF